MSHSGLVDCKLHTNLGIFFFNNMTGQISFCFQQKVIKQLINSTLSLIFIIKKKGKLREKDIKLTKKAGKKRQIKFLLIHPLPYSG